MRVSLIIIALILSVSPRLSVADTCDPILAGMFDKIEYTSETDLQIDLLKIRDWSLEKMEEEHSKAKGGLRAMLGVFVVGADAETNRSTLDSLKVHLRDEERFAWQSSEYVSVKLLIANRHVPALAEAWLKCKALQWSSSVRANTLVCNPQSGEFLVSVEYFPVTKTDPNSVKVTLATPTNAAPIGPLVIKNGTIISEFSGLSQRFRRTDCHQDSIVRFDLAGRPSVQAHCGLIPCPDVPQPYSFPHSWSFSYFGAGEWARIGGKDNEMDIDPNDRVGVELQTRITHNQRAVYLELKFSAVEAGGNGTRLGGHKPGIKIYDAPDGVNIEGVICEGGCDRLLSHTYVGAKPTRHANMSVPGTAGTYWQSLHHTLDSSSGNDLPAFGIDGSLFIKVKLKPLDEACPPCPK